MNQTCKTCRHWAKVNAAPAHQPIGLCHRRAPTPLLVGAQKHPVTGDMLPMIRGIFPETRPDVWCGDWNERAARPDFAAVDLSKLEVAEVGQ